MRYINHLLHLLCGSIFLYGANSDLSSQIKDDLYLFTTVKAGWDSVSRDNMSAIVKFKISNRNLEYEEAVKPIGLVSIADVGSLFGIAYSPQAKKIFASAFLQRHIALGYLGSGGIYMIDPNRDIEGQKSIYFANLDKVGIPTSKKAPYRAYVVNGDNYKIVDDYINFLPVIGSNLARGVLVGLNITSNDPLAYVQVGKLSLGGLEISDDGQYLYTVNLYDRKIYELDLINPALPEPILDSNDRDRVRAIEIPNPCTYSKKAGQYRPFAIKYKDNRLYVGIVCSGQNIDGSSVFGATVKDMRGFIYSTPLDGGSFNWSRVFQFDLDYRGSINLEDKPWRVWSNRWGKEPQPTPIISKIEFDSKDNLYIGVSDLKAFQTGLRNRALSTSRVHYLKGEFTGDIIKAKFEDGEYSFDLEATKNLNALKSYGGLGIFSLYTQDSLEYIFSTFISTLNNEIYSYGFTLYTINQENENKKSDIKSFNLSISNLNNLLISGIFGDLELAKAEDVDIEPKIDGVKAQPLKKELFSAYGTNCIGDFIWDDRDRDGLQSSKELGVDNITIYLLDGSGTQIDSTKSANGGFYQFCNLDEGEYKIKLDFTSLPKGYIVTNRDVGSDDNIDSDIDRATGESEFIYLKDGEFYRALDIGIHQVNSILEIKKYTSSSSGEFLDGNSEDGSETPTLIINDKVVWKYVIKNLGDTFLVDIKVVDDKEGDISCPKESLEPSEQMSCFKEGVVSSQKYENIATVTAKDEYGQELESSDKSSYIATTKMNGDICVGDFIWYDKDTNGIQDSDEAGVIGLEVKLLTISGELLDVTQSDKQGRYQFCNLEQNGSYIIKFSIPKDYLVTKKDVGSDLRDSDANLNGEIYIENIDETAYQFDLGIYCRCSNSDSSDEASSLNFIFEFIIISILIGVLNLKRSN